MRILSLALLCFGYQDPSDISRWISDLDHDEVARRDEAQKNLISAGEPILPTLNKALESGVHRNNPGARTALEDIERAIRERAHDARERRRDLS
jgi:hypothetical protein